MTRRYGDDTGETAAIFGRKLLEDLSDRATLGSLPLFGGKGKPAAAGKSLNVGL